MLIRIVLIIAVLTAIWLIYQYYYARQVKGRRAEISPFRQNSNLSPLGTITVTLQEIERKGDDLWFVCQLDEELALGDLKFDYIKLKGKSVDDHLNRKKPVVCYVFAGSSKNAAPPQFIDWGFVKVL